MLLRPFDRRNGMDGVDTLDACAGESLNRISDRDLKQSAR